MDGEEKIDRSEENKIASPAEVKLQHEKHIL